MSSRELLGCHQRKANKKKEFTHGLAYALSGRHFRLPENSRQEFVNNLEMCFLPLKPIACPVHQRLEDVYFNRMKRISGQNLGNRLRITNEKGGRF